MKLTYGNLRSILENIRKNPDATGVKISTTFYSELVESVFELSAALDQLKPRLGHRPPCNEDDYEECDADCEGYEIVHEALDKWGAK